MKLTNQEYEELNKQASPNTKEWKTLPVAFAVGGLICMLGQALCDLYVSLGVEKLTASSLSSISLVFLSCLLTGFSLFGKIAKFAGAGTLVPITGFANAMASPALEFKSEGLILGLGAKMFVIAGPVIVYGIAASIVYGVILSLFHL